MKKIFLLLLFISTPLAAQQKALTIEETIKIGLENSKALRISQARLEGAEAKSTVASSAQYFSIKASSAYTRLSEIDPFRVNVPFSPTPITLSPVVLNNYQLKLTVQQPLFTGFQLKSSADVADFNAQASSKDYESDKSELIFNIKNAYWGLFKAIEFRKVVDENVDQVKAHLNDIQNLQKQGLATTNDVLKVQVQLSNVQLLQIDASNAVRVAIIALNSLIGLPLSNGITLTSTVYHQPKDFGDANTLVRKALEIRPELRASEFRVRASEAAVTAAKGNWFPQIFLVGNYYYARPNSRILPTQDKFNSTWDIGVAVQWDLWNWGATNAQANQAKAQQTQTSLAYEQLKDAITLEVTQNYLAGLQTREKVKVADQGKQQAEENYRVTKERFKQGLATNSDLLDAEVALLQAKTNYTQALIDFELAQAKLEKSVGG